MVAAIPRADIALPWDEPVEDPVAVLAAARAALGDTFVVDSGGRRWWFVFGPIGVRAFYAIDERIASKGIADWEMLRRKLPDELFVGRRTLPHELWSRHATASYLQALDAAIAVSFDELGSTGSMELFAWSRRLGHRMGLASWGGIWPSRDPSFGDLIDAFDRLDGSMAFVDPVGTRHVVASGHADERAALAALEARFATAVAERSAHPIDDLFGAIVDRWSDAGDDERDRGIARDVVLVHLGSMSNLFAALGWTVGHLLLHPETADQVRAGDRVLAERCALESTRIAQRSLMSRAVLRDTDLDTDRGVVRVTKGDSIATLLALTNTSAAPGLGAYDPSRWEKRRLRDASALPARELVATFGHGSHTCPAQPFSLAAIVAATSSLLDRYDLIPRFDTILPVRGQIGGVARSREACVVEYRLR
jgi:cytochrome P450